jgi:hypothetical protein
MLLVDDQVRAVPSSDLLPRGVTHVIEGGAFAIQVTFVERTTTTDAGKENDN